MKLSSILLPSLAALPVASAWGSLGHMASAYVASSFVSNTTQAYLQKVLENNNDDYLASIASWADSIRYTRWGRFTSNFHFIDAKDSPPEECSVDFERDCKANGCVLTALANYTARATDLSLPPLQRQDAAKFVVHFIGDLHQPLHNENVARGGNSIKVKFNGVRLNLHHVWDSTIIEKWIGVNGRPNGYAEGWAKSLVDEINDGKFTKEAGSWLDGLNYTDPIGTGLQWSRECNKLICTHVFPQGPSAIVGQELSGDYYLAAGLALEKQVAQAGFRMAAWLDHLVEDIMSKSALGGSPTTIDEL
ncbi:Nuclease S1 [Ceratocystis lukuohia]|uniref:Nuclease S1 n=1 Tax=Ceratocystis lukuohia TaxID=2019550 RepID=A0ABR4MRR8_9PEZI